MYELSDRQKQILGLVVRSYIEDGSAIGSKTLVTRFGLDVSSATVRNELAYLTEVGLLVQPHTSAGRVPTEKGYRYFVQRLVRDFQLPHYEQQMIRHQFHQARLELEQWMRLAAAVLAHTSRVASIVTAPRPRFNRMKHVQLINTQGRLVLMILVLYGGEIQQQMLDLAEPLPQARLTATSERLNSRLEGCNFDQVESRFNRLDDALDRDIARLIIEALRRRDARVITEIYRDGLTNILDEEGTRQAVRVVEEGALLADVVGEVMEPDQTGIQVVIGGEGRWEELKHCTLILARYGVENELTGEIAVVGSMRMPYERNISAVRYVADIMSGFLQEYLAEDVEASEVDEGV